MKTVKNFVGLRACVALPATVKAVDVFYLYPTAWQKVNDSDPIGRLLER
jgi:hypothetical protein